VVRVVGLRKLAGVALRGEWEDHRTAKADSSVRDGKDARLKGQSREDVRTVLWRARDMVIQSRKRAKRGVGELCCEADSEQILRMQVRTPWLRADRVAFVEAVQKVAL
jgi:hypothetical protein